MEIGGINSKGHEGIRLRVSNTGMEARRGLVWKKAESSSSDQRRDFPGPLRAMVRGARTRAVLRRNRRYKSIIPRNL